MNTPFPKLPFVVFLLSVFLLMTGCEQSTLDDGGYSPELLAELQEQRTQVLVDAEWLADYAYYPDVHILELGRTRHEFDQGHIPGAKFIDWRVDITDPEEPEKYNILPPHQFEKLMSRLGINPDSSIVLYDTLSNRVAVRMYWTLKYYMHDSVKVLDGGLPAWQRGGHPLSDKPAEIGQSQYRVEAVNGSLITDIHYIFGKVSDPGHNLVDGRPFSQYTGQDEGKVFHTGSNHQRLGHIYGAHSAPWADNLREDGTFKSTEELLLLYAPHEISRDNTLITYCNEGLHAAMPWFVLHELLGYADVRLYDSSLAEWANREDTPMITGQCCI